MLRLVLDPAGTPSPDPQRPAPSEAIAAADAPAVAPPISSSGESDGPTPPAQLAAGSDQPSRRLGQLSQRLQGAGDDVLVLAADAVLPDAAIRLVLGSSGAATLTRRGARSHPVATAGATVLSAATAIHPVEGADADAVGVLLLPAAQLPAASSALSVAAVDAHAGSWPAVDPFDLVLAAVVRGGVEVAAVPVEPFPGGRADDPAQARQLAADVAGADEARLASRRSSRGDDGFYSTFVLRRLSRPISRWGAAHGISANAVTDLSGVLGVIAAVAFGTGDRAGLLTGAVLLQVSLVLDCVDGEIARTTGTFSAFGAWLDASLDRVKEYGALAGLAVGADRHGHDLWLVALAAMVVQTARHVQDFGFDKGVLAVWRAPRIDRRPLTDHTPWTRPPGSAPTPRATSASDWLRRVIHMPIAERWLVLSLGAAFDRPAWSLLAYLVLTGSAAAWTLAGALRRSLRSDASYPAGLRAVLARYRDDGLLGLLLNWREPPGGHARRGQPGGTAGWLVPVGVTALEGVVLMLAALAVTSDAGERAWAFAWFAAVAWHRYDLIYRWRDRGLAVPAWADAAGGGWLARSIVVAVAAVAGALVPVLIVGSIWLAVVYVPESLLAGAQSWRGHPAAGAVATSATAKETA